MDLTFVPIDLSQALHFLSSKSFIDNVSYDDVSNSFKIKITDYFAFLSLPIQIVEKLNALSYTLGRNDLDYFKEQVNELVNSWVTLLKAKLSRFQHVAKLFHPVILTILCHNIREFPYLNQFIESEQNFLDLNNSIVAMHRYLPVLRHTSLKAILTFNTFKTGHLANNSLNLTEIIWTYSGDKRKYSGLLARHNSDHYNQPHYHVFRDIDHLINANIFNLYRTVRAQSDRAFDPVLYDDRVVYGFQTHDCFHIKNEDFGQFIKSNFASVNLCPVSVVNRHFEHVYLQLKRWILSLEVPVIYRRKLVTKIAMTPLQLQMTVERELPVVENRIHLIELPAPLYQDLSQSDVLMKISQIPTGPQADMSDLIFFPVQNYSGSTSLDVLYNQVIPIFNEYEYTEMIDRPLFPSYNDINVFNLLRIRGFLTYRQMINRIYVSKNFSQSLSGLFTTLANSSIKGAILHAFLHDLPISAKLTYNLDKLGYDAEYLSVNLTGSNNMLFTDFISYLVLAEYLEMFSNQQLMTVADVWTLTSKRRLVFINSRSKYIGLATMFPLWKFVYYQTDNQFVGDPISIADVMLNLDANLLYINLHGVDLLDQFERVIMKAFDSRGAVFMISVMFISIEEVLTRLYRTLMTLPMPNGITLGVDLEDGGLLPKLMFLIGTSVSGDTYPFITLRWEDQDQLYQAMIKIQAQCIQMSSCSDYAVTLPQIHKTFNSEDPSVGSNFNVIFKPSNVENGLGCAASMSKMVTVAHRSNGDDDYYIAAGTVDHKSREILSRMDGPRTLNLNLMSLANSDQDLTILYKPTLSPEQSLAATRRYTLNNLFRSEAASKDLKNVIDIGSGDLANIHLSRARYIAIDKDPLPNYNLNNVEVNQFYLSVEENDTFRQYLLNLPPAHLLLLDSVFFVSESDLRSNQIDLTSNLAETLILPILVNNGIIEYCLATKSTLTFSLPVMNDEFHTSYANLFNVTEAQVNEELTRHYAQFGTHEKVVLFTLDEIQYLYTEILGLLANYDGGELTYTKTEIVQSGIYNGYLPNPLFVQNPNLLTNILVTYHFYPERQVE
ncbi:hypothetical protein [Acrididae reovirus]|nr:hypothetical protein [Acrididae reovirus]